MQLCIKTDDPFVVICAACDQPYANPASFRQHARNKHDPAATPIPCPNCGKVCSNPTFLRIHLRQTHGEFAIKPTRADAKIQIDSDGK